MKRLSLLIVICIDILMLQSITVNFTYIEKNLNDIYKFKENGIKIQSLKDSDFKLDITNYDEKYYTNELIENNYKVKTKQNARIMKYTKYKINNLKETLYKLKNMQIFNNIKFIPLDRGYVGTGVLMNGEKINIALSSYDTGMYLIVSTPIIYVEY